jgi:hypothetical protein
MIKPVRKLSGYGITAATFDYLLTVGFANKDMLEPKEKAEGDSLITDCK